MQKHAKLFGIIFLLLLGVIVLQQIWPKFAPTESKYLIAIKNFSKTQPSSLSIETHGVTLTFNKKDDHWRLNDKNADSTKIDTIIKGLTPSSAPELVSENLDKQENYEVGASPSAKISFGTNPIFMVGKNADPRGSYVRIDGANEIYVLPDLASYTISSESAFWYDKTIIAIDQEKQSKITLVQSNKTITFQQKDKVWKKIDGSDADKDKLASLSSLFTSMQANSLAVQTDVKNYVDPTPITVSIEHDGKTDTVELLKGVNDYLIRRASDSEYFKLDNTSAERITSLL